MVRDVKRETAMETTRLSESMMAMNTFQQPLVSYLVSHLDVSDKWVRIMAADLLGTLGDTRVAEHLIPLLADKDKDLRIAAAKSLAKIGSPEIVFALSREDNCENCMIRFFAEEAFGKLKVEKKIARHE